MTVPRVLLRNPGVLGKFLILGMSLLRGARGRLVPPRSLLPSSFPSLPLLPLFFPFFDLPAWSFGVSRLLARSILVCVRKKIKSIHCSTISCQTPRLMSKRSFATESGEEVVCQLRLTTELVNTL